MSPVYTYEVANHSLERRMSKKQPIPTELPWSWLKSPGWQGQFLRMQRWYDRLDQAEDESDIEDFLYAFFQNCYHLRDWLENTGVLPEQVLGDFINANEEMQICRDICNATKHFSLNRSAFDREFALAREYVGPARGRFGQDATLVVHIEEKKYDAFDLAAACMRLWRDFLISQKLDLPSK